jgi:hypothetical protein
MNPSLRASLIALSLAALAACSTPDGSARPAGSPRPAERIQISPELLRAFREEIEAHYEMRFLAEQPVSDADALKRELDLAQKGEESARARLVDALEGAGSTTARDAAKDRLKGLLPIIRDALVRTGIYAFLVEDPEGEGASLGVVRLVGAHQERTIELFGEKFTYELYLHDATVVEDYPTYRARKLAGPGAAPFIRPAIVLGRSVFIDLAAAARIGKESFFPRVEHYRALAKAAEDPGLFAKDASDATKLLADVKEILRWRSLEGFWSTVRALPPDDQARRFAEDYEAREEVRAAAEAFELERARAAGDVKPSGERLQAIERRAMLSAIAHGEPVGEMATTVGLAGARLALGRPAPDPNADAVLRAAAGVTAEIVREIGPGGKAPSDDVEDFARLSRATSDTLRSAAAAIYKRSAAPPPGEGKRPG